jgi:hypothetical protein
MHSPGIIHAPAPVLKWQYPSNTFIRENPAKIKILNNLTIFNNLTEIANLSLTEVKLNYYKAIPYSSFIVSSNEKKLLLGRRLFDPYGSNNDRFTTE